MYEFPEFAERTLDAAYVAYTDLQDNEAFADDMTEIAQNDPKFPTHAIGDEGDESDVEFISALTCLTIAKWTYDNNPFFRDFFDMIRNELQAYNSGEMLNGYLNTLIDDINPILAQLDITPIETMPEDPLSTD